MKTKLGKDKNLCSPPFWNFLVTAFPSSRPRNAAVVLSLAVLGLFFKHWWRENFVFLFFPFFSLLPTFKKKNGTDLIFTLRIFQKPVIFYFLTSLKLIFFHWSPIAKTLSRILALFLLLLLSNSMVVFVLEFCLC